MATANLSSNVVKGFKPPKMLRLALYEQVASMLISLLILVGLAVVVLFMIWMSLRVQVVIGSPPPIADIEGGGSENGVLNESMEIESPNPEEIARETDLTEPTIEETVTELLEAITSVQVDLTEPVTTNQPSGPSHGDGNAVGLGGGGPGKNGFARQQRWVIQFQEGGTLTQYGKQLAFFGIELGAITSNGRVDYAFNLDRPTPSKRTGPGATEKRLYFSWRDGNLRQADRKLLAKAGVDLSTAMTTVQFYNEQTENLLANLEFDYKKRPAAEIRRTRFGVRTVPNGYAFYVIDQTPLR